MARQVPLTCPGHTRPVVDLAFSGLTEEGSYLISASKDGLPMLRAGDTGDWIGTFEGHKGAVWGATLNDDASRAATGAADFSAKLWDPTTGEMLATYNHRHIVKAVSFTKDSKQLVTGCQDKKVYLFDCERPDASGQQLKQHNTMVKRVCCGGSDLVFSSSEDRSLSVWDLRCGEEVHNIQTSNAVTSLELSRDGTLLTATHDRTVSVFDVQTVQTVKEFTMPSKMYSASLHPSKSSIVAGGEDFQLYKFDFVSGEQLESYKGHFGPVHSVRYSPDGEVYASGSEDGTLRLWQNTVGKTYGLWVAVNTAEQRQSEETSTPAETVAAASS